jgi:nitroimidazol reductase NimA-like FMN-containing flavoprotein (pyridoxamine 5'-phosphate oxidase superfamily)
MRGATGRERHIRARSPRTEVIRKRKRASYDRAAAYAILDEALIGSLAVVIDGEPFVQPMIHARDGDELILHGSSANRMLGAIEAGARACFSVSIIDGLVLGRTVPDHTFQYRSLSIYGLARSVTDPAEKRARMRKVFDHIIKDRWETLPPVGDDYLATVKVLVMPLEECVAKINADVPEDAPGDPPHSVWSGVLPFAFATGPLQPAPGPQPDPNAALAHYRRPQDASRLK